nr:tetratricopeptide repeat protein [Sphingomonas telluris]
MAPNFAPAHATLALLQGEGSPEAEPQLRRAVALDPSYSEAWSWLGNSLYAQGRHREAMQAYGRALELDPLLIPAVVNYAMTAAELGDHATTERLARKVAAAGASPELIVSLRASDAYIRRDYSAALKLLAERGRDASGHPKRLLWGDWFESLTGIGYYDALHLITGCPDWYAPLVRGQRLPPTVFEGKPVAPEEFWTSEFFSAPAARAMILHGRSSDLVRLYRAGFRNADDFITRSERRALFPVLASDIAVALQAEGQEDEARYLLDSAATRLEMVLKRTPLADATGQLAMIRAVQGDRAQSVTLLNKGIDREWLPNGRDVALDLAQEPAFEGLQGDPGFEAARKRILDHIAEERAELGPLKV